MIKHPKQKGFTLVEMVVSVALFSTAITIAVGALLVLISSNQQLQQEQSVMTNLSFALDSMTREIRTGTHYFCDSRPNKNSGPDKIFLDATNLDSLALNTQDCANGNNSSRDFHGVAFREGGNSITGTGSDHILYFFDKTQGKIYRRVGANAAQSIVSDGIYINNAEFFVTGSTPLSIGAANIDQPAVTIFIEAVESNDPTAKPYYMQTTVTQRTTDI